MDTKEYCADILSVLQLIERHLENHICTGPFGKEGIQMPKNMSIDRSVVINGVLTRVRASSEQEYAERILRIAAKKNSQERDPHAFDEYAAAWFETFSKPNIESSTAVTYKRQLTNTWIPFFGSRPVESITPKDIQSCFNKMHVAKETKQKARTVLNMILEQALEDGLIEKNPMTSRSIRITGRSAKETEPYTIQQMRYLASHIPDIKCDQDRLFLSLLLFHPLRLEEALGLRYCDIDSENRMISVSISVTHPTRNFPEIKQPKTESSVRKLPLSEETLSLVKSYGHGYLIGGDAPLSYTQVRNMCKRIARDTGFSEQITPRRFRTTVLTDIYDTTKDIKCAQYAAGHTTASMTLKHYVKGRESATDTASVVTSLYTSSKNKPIEKPISDFATL